MRLLLICTLLLISASLKGQDKNEFEELANGYYNQGKITLAAEFYSKAAYAYWNRNHLNQAASCFQKAYNLFSSQGNAFASITVGNNLGLIYLDIESYSNAYTAFNNVLTYARKTKNTTELLNALINVGTVAIELSQFNEAVSKVTEALSIARELNNLKLTAKCYSLLAESYDKMNDAPNAFKYFELYSAINQKIKQLELEDLKQLSAEEISKANELKRITEIELKIKKGELKLTQDSLSITERLAYERQMQVELRNEQLKKKEIQLRYEMQVKRTLIFGILLTVFFLLVLGFLLRQKQKDNKVLKQQKEEITNQRNILDLQNKRITDSIHYGLRIQQAMLPETDELNKNFEHFVIYRPKDIVSGDFYWFGKIHDNESTSLFVTVVDCTGHGVPGAFMSMIGHRFLSEIIIERKVYLPSEILKIIDSTIRKELNQDNVKSVDGMDIAICRITIKNGSYDELTFAGAKRPILLCRSNDKKLELIDGDRQGIGGFRSEKSKNFTDKVFRIQQGDLIFMYSDGIIDQPNTLRNRFGTNRLISLISENIDQPMDKIQKSIEKTFDFHMKPEEQRDDVTMIGIRLIEIV